MINPLVSLQTLQIPIEVDWKSVVSGAAGGLIVFLVSLIAEFLVRHWEKSREKSERQIVRFKNDLLGADVAASFNPTRQVFQYASSSVRHRQDPSVVPTLLYS